MIRRAVACRTSTRLFSLPRPDIVRCLGKGHACTVLRIYTKNVYYGQVWEPRSALGHSLAGSRDPPLSVRTRVLDVLSRVEANPPRAKFARGAICIFTKKRAFARSPSNLSFALAPASANRFAVPTPRQIGRYAESRALDVIRCLSPRALGGEYLSRGNPLVSAISHRTPPRTPYYTRVNRADVTIFFRIPRWFLNRGELCDYDTELNFLFTSLLSLFFFYRNRFF